MPTLPRLLLVGRDASLNATIQDTLGADVRVCVCADIEQARARLVEQSFSVLLVHLGEGEGEAQVLPLLRALTCSRRICATLVLAESFSEEQIAGLFRVGISDYLSLPGDLSRLSWVVSDLLTWSAPQASPPPDHVPAAPVNPFDGFSANMGTLEEQIRRVASRETMVLLTGETGTGKTRLARLIHDLSSRREHPFFVVDCGTLSAELIGSDLFGHAKGSFTSASSERAGKLAAAGAGTLFIDEVNSLPLDLQSKLLRAMDDKVFEPVGSDKLQPLRARIVVASNVPLEEEVAAGRFRSDLFFRLNVIGFYLPALRDRRSCILPLARDFLRDATARNARPDLVGFTPACERLLESYDWPGNIRELRNAVLRCVALSFGPRATPEDLPEVIQQCSPRVVSSTHAPASIPPVSLAAAPGPLTLASSKQELEIRRILEALQKHGDNRLKAARELGISRVAFYKKLRKYGLMTPRYKKPGQP